MAMRFRKSIKVAPGVKVNLGKKSAGVSVGNKFFRKTFSTSGRKTTSSSIPGTGISFVDTKSEKKKTVKAKAAKQNNTVNYKELKASEAKALEAESAVNASDPVSGVTEPQARKMKLWPWLAMAVVLLVVLGALFNNNSPETAEETSDVASTTQFATTTEFTYDPSQVVLQDYNGALTAFVGNKQVPFTGIVPYGIDSYVVKDGIVDSSFNGVFDDNGTMKLVRNGKVDNVSNGVVGAGNGEWYAVQNGVVMTAINGIRSNDYGDWYVQDGKVQLDQSGVVKTEGKEYVIEGGKVDKAADGVTGVSGDWVYADDGVVHTEYTGVKKNEYGKWYVKDGHVDFNYSGDVSSDGSTYIIKDGKVDSSQNGVMKVGDKWAYVSDGMINTNYTGVASNEYGSWYIKKGLVQLDYDGVITANGGQRYNVSGGKATKVTTTRAATRASSDSGSGYSDSGSGGGYVASSNSSVFHHSWCSAAQNILSGNKITFSSRSEAVASGRRPCKICTP